MLADFAGMAIEVSLDGQGAWQVVFPPGAFKPVEYCTNPQRKAQLQAAVANLTGSEIQLTFRARPGEAPQPKQPTKENVNDRAQRVRELSEHPYIKKLCEVLDGEIVRVDSPQPGVPAPMGKQKLHTHEPTA